MSDKLIHSCEKCLVVWKNFRTLSKEELRLVDHNRYEASFRPGEIIFKQGSPANNAVFLASGLAKIYIEGMEGRNFILDIALPSNLILGPGVHVSTRNTFTLSALSFVQACFINLDIVNQLIRQNPAFALGMLEDLSAKSFRVHNKLVSLTQKKMPGRIAEAILYLSDKVFGKEEFDPVLSRQELGEMTNMAKENVVRILKELEGEGVIESGHSRIRIVDRERLMMISEKS